jgi:RsiW-degrading membrane proteinase PrsW (M82 family)
MVDGTFCQSCGSPVGAQQQRCGTCGAALTPSSGVTSHLTPAPLGNATALPAGKQGGPAASDGARTPQAGAYVPNAPPPWTASAYGHPPASNSPPPAGYPVYPQGGALPYPSYPYPQPAAYPYSYPYAYPQYYYYPVYVAPQRPPGETLALVVSWIVTVAGGLSILCGLFVALLLLLVLNVAATADSLSTTTVFVAFSLAPLIGGAYAVYFGIRGIMRKPSPRFSLPNPLLFVALTALTLGTGLVLWHESPAPGPAIAVVPLAIMSGVLPAFAILAFTAWRLHLPSTRRHVWMSLFYGATLAVLLAAIIELVVTLLIFIVARSMGYNGQSLLTNPTNPNPGDPVEVVLLLLTISVVAPVVEEGLKPLGAVLIMRRLRTPASAFLMGVAAGVGFNIFETVGYIGSGEADWIGVAIERIGAGLLHGVGAGMATLGWYYLINGKGVPHRWLRGFGGIFYAMLQHAIFNGSNLLGLLPGPVGSWMQQPIFIGKLPLDGGALLFFIYYGLIFALLVYVTGRLAHSPPTEPASPTRPPAVQASDTLGIGGPTAVGSGGR